jgi:zinc and cadmium transporter
MHNHNSFEGSLLTGIALHKIPVTIVLMSLFSQAGFSKLKSFTLIGIFALMAPLGTLSGNLIHELSYYHKEIMAIVVGIFLHISTTILFESSEGHKFNFQKLIAIALGSVLAWML